MFAKLYRDNFDPRTIEMSEAEFEEFVGEGFPIKLLGITNPNDIPEYNPEELVWVDRA